MDENEVEVKGNKLIVRSFKPLDGLGCLILGLFLAVLIVIPIVLEYLSDKEEKPDLVLQLVKTSQSVRPKFEASHFCIG